MSEKIRKLSRKLRKLTLGNFLGNFRKPVLAKAMKLKRNQIIFLGNF